MSKLLDASVLDYHLHEVQPELPFAEGNICEVSILDGATSLPAEGGGLRSKTEGECGTLKSAIAIVYAFSLLPKATFAKQA